MNSGRTLAVVGAVCAFLAVPPPGASAPSAEGSRTLALAAKGHTGYAIVIGAEARAVDRYAAEQLALYLGQMTGARFAVISAVDLAADAPAIFVGLSAPASTRLGETDPLDGFADQEHAWRSRGQDIFLYGKGVHGNLHAVMAFLENELGWRWYSLFELPVLPERPVLALTPFHGRRGMSYLYRSVDLQRSRDYPSQLGVNMHFDKHARRGAARSGVELPPRTQRTFVSARPEIEGWTHSLHRYIPPRAAPKNAFPWLDRDNYFETHPEFFTLGSNGQRVPNRQLCFSQPGLRAELTRNVLLQIAHENEEQLIVEIGAEDNPGTFCHCESCRELEARYASVGGPMYDFLIEICALLAERHPTVSIKTFAYRRSQTQKPPTLPEGRKLPDNLIVEFAPIEDNFFADWTHPDPWIQETYADLQAWSAILAPGNLWSWIYPVPYGSGRFMPVSTVPRLIANMRLMHAARRQGYYVDMGSMQHSRSSWSDLVLYLIHRLGQDIDADTDAPHREFTDFMYGPAAPLDPYVPRRTRSGAASHDRPVGAGLRVHGRARDLVRRASLQRRDVSLSDRRQHPPLAGTFRADEGVPGGGRGAGSPTHEHAVGAARTRSCDLVEMDRAAGA